MVNSHSSFFVYFIILHRGKFMEVKLTNKTLTLTNNNREVAFNMLKSRFTSEEVFNNVNSVLQYAFSNHKELFGNYLKLKLAYTTKKVDLPTFIGIINKYIVTDDTKVLSQMYVNKYQVLHDVEVKSDTNINSALVITETQITDLHKISFIMKMLLPIIGDYISMYDVCDENGKAMKDDEVYYSINVDIMARFNENNIIESLYNFIQARVTLTSFEHKIMWDMLENVNVSKTTTIVDIYDKVLVLVLYKLDVTKYPIYLINSAINNQIIFNFRKRFKVPRLPSNGYRESASGLSLYEKIEVTMKRKDEGMLILDELNKKDKLKQFFAFFRESGYGVSKEELEYVNANIKLNSFQMTIVMLFYAKYTNSYYFDISRAEYVLLLTMIQKWVAQQKRFKYLHKVLLASIDHDARKSVVKKAFIKRLHETKDYKEIIESKYNLIEGKFDNGENPFLSLINYMNNKFFVLPAYDVYKTCPECLNDKEYLSLNKNIDEATHELLLFIKAAI